MKTAVHSLIIFAALLFTVPSGAQSTGPQTSTSKGTRLILLGTAGGPSIKKSRAQPANALIVNGSVYIIDAGNGGGLTGGRITIMHSLMFRRRRCARSLSPTFIRTTPPITERFSCALG